MDSAAWFFLVFFVNFVAAMIWFSYALIVAVRHRREDWLLLAILFVCIATAIRVIGVGLGGALCATLTIQNTQSRKVAHDRLR